MRKILVVQRRMTHYRVPFFNRLRQRLAERQFELVVAYGRGTAEEESKNDGAELDWGLRLPTRYFLSGKICYQPIGPALEGCDMLVVTLENKLICNLWHQFRSSPYRVGLWGHGRNLQGDPRSFREAFKRRVAKKADWWFGYTDLSRPLIAESGFPDARITTLDNAVDTDEMRLQYERSLTRSSEDWRRRHGVGPGPLGIFVGSLYGEKRIDFLLQAAARIRESVKDFELVLIGSGPLESLAVEFSRANSWAHYLGVQKGEAKTDALGAASVMLNPGLVGLGILDSFVCEVPMVTTDCGLHSPEIAYLDSGRNGLMTPDSLEEYVAQVVGLLRDDTRIAAMKSACAESARRYTVDNMAINFTTGIQRCMDHPPFRASV